MCLTKVWIVYGLPLNTHGLSDLPLFHGLPQDTHGPGDLLLFHGKPQHTWPR